MSVLYLLIPLAALLVIIGIAVFMWSVKSGQFEDLEGPGFRVLMDDDEDLIPDDAKLRKPVASESSTGESASESTSESLSSETETSTKSKLETQNKAKVSQDD